MALLLTLVGQPLPETTFTYDWQRTALYALGVGAGTNDLPWLFEKHPAYAVLPSFAVVPTTDMVMDGLRAAGADFRKLVHGAQTITLHAPLPAAGTLTTRGQITEIQDKGKGAVVIFKTQTVDPDDALLFETTWSIFCRGQGGFGGERGAAPEQHPATEGSVPLVKVTVPTRPDQALLYRLSGDFNPLHVDPALATQVGFDGPILHGLCTYGFAVREVITHLCDGDASRLCAFAARFSNVVYPGDALTLVAHPTADPAVVALEVSVGDRVVLDQAWARLR